MPIHLIAFDFGSTTSKALTASAQLVRNAVTGRTEIREVQTLSRSEPVFTPFSGERLDEPRVRELVEGWLAAGGPRAPGETVAGGVIITGLAAKKENAQAIASAVRSRIGEAVVAVADDPGQESWLAFMGSCAALSGAHPGERFVNFDIGGGTTNIALGANKTVSATGSLWVGARHFQFEPGTRRLTGISDPGRKLLQRLKIPAKEGETLNPGEIASLVRFYVQALETAVAAKAAGPEKKNLRFLEQLRFPALPEGQPPVLTFSGGVGELVYRVVAGEKFPASPYGDLGVDLAQGIVNSRTLSRNLRSFVPLHLGRATVCGLAFHGMEASGSTVFLPRPGLLPLRDLPLLGQLRSSSPPAEVSRLIARAKRHPGGSCLLAELPSTALPDLKSLAAKVAGALRKNRFPKGVPLIIFLPQNFGKTFGHYATDWGRVPVDLLVIDEIDSEMLDRKAFFASVHRSQATGGKDQNLLVSFYGGMDQT